MKVTRGVLLDLLPLYLAGEASEETRALVEQEMANDPELGRIATLMKRTRLPEAPRRAAPDPEMRAFTRTKQLMFQQNLFLMLAIAFTVLFAVSMGFLIDSYPGAGAVSFLLSVVFWVVYWVKGWRISKL